MGEEMTVSSTLFFFRENPVTGAHINDVDRVQVNPIKQARDVKCVLF